MTRLITAGIIASAMLMPAFAKADAGSGNAKGAASPQPVPAAGVQPVPAAGVVAGQAANAAGQTAIPASAAEAATSTAYLPITGDIPLPEKRPAAGAKRGTKSIYPFDTLALGQSFGIKGKTWKNVSSTVASANDRFRADDKLINYTNADGSPKMIDVPLPQGGTAQVQARGPERQFWGCAVDPAKDPQGASVRVWRVSPDDPRLVKKPRKAKAAA